MILYIESPKYATSNLLELINKFGKVSGYKINAQNSLAFLYTYNERSEREIKETIPFIITSKRIKYLGTNLLKEGKYLYSENWDADEENWRRHKQMVRYAMFMNWKNRYCQNDCTTQGNLQIQCNP